MQRRTLLRLGVTASAVLLVAGVTAALIQPGLGQGLLSSSGRTVFSAVSSAVLDKTLPAEPVARKAAIEGLLSRIDVLISALPSHAQDELSQLLSVLASAGGRRALAGLSTPWADANVVDVQAALQGMRLSSFTLRQQAYAALHDITAGAYFSEPASWALLGYPGPTKI
ncbi:MAG: hypothetical protein V4718_16925 [Pseudomonadota bacterium]